MLGLPQQKERHRVDALGMCSSLAIDSVQLYWASLYWSSASQYHLAAQNKHWILNLVVPYQFKPSYVQ